jgi:hypothetical protein
MSERHKTHNGRDLDGHFKVKQADVEDLLADPAGADHVQDDVRLGGAVEDVGADAGQRAEEIGREIDLNRYEVDHLVGRDREPGSRHKDSA